MMTSARPALAPALPLSLALLALAGCGREAIPEADVIFTNAGAPSSGLAHAAATPGSGPGAANGGGAAIAVAGGRVLASGDREAVARHRGKGTRVVDLGGDRLSAGLEDAYTRPAEIGERLLNEAAGGAIFLDLATAESEEDAVQRVRLRARVLGPGGWILGRDWDERRWIVARAPDARLISDIVQYNPVFLVRRDGAAVWVNNKALDAAGLGRMPVPVSGAARDAILRRVPAPSADERKAAIVTALDRAVAAGVVRASAVASTGRLGLEDRLAPAGAVLDPWRALAKRGRLPVRVSLLVPAPSAAAEALLAGGPESYPGGGRLEIRTLLFEPEPASDAAEAARWAGRAAAAGFDVVVRVGEAGALAPALALAAAARSARAGTAVRLVLAAGLAGGDPDLAEIGKAGVAEAVVEDDAGAGASAGLARRMREAGIAVAVGSGSGDWPIAGVGGALADPWSRQPAVGDHADFVILPGAALPAAAPVRPRATWIGGMEIHRAESRPRG